MLTAPDRPLGYTSGAGGLVCTSGNPPFVIVFLVACGPGPKPEAPDSEPHSGDLHSASEHTGNADHTAAEHTAAPPLEVGWTITFTPPSPVEPWVVLVGEPGEGLGRGLYRLGDTDADGLDELAVSSPSHGNSRVLTPDLFVPGEQSVSASTVATLPYPVTEYAMARAGDTDRDGFDDLWFYNQLFRGPLAGAYAADGGAMEIRGDGADGVIGGFDADGDGWLDVGLNNYDGVLVVHHGPFPTDRPGYHSYEPEFDPTQVTLHAPNHGAGVARYLGGLDRPGQLVATISLHPAEFFDLAQPRGGSFYGGFATYSTGYFDVVGEMAPMGDTDGDGLPEALLHRRYRIGTPVGGDYPDQPTDPTSVRPVPTSNGQQMFPCGDLTGDGLADLVTAYYTALPDGTYGFGWTTLPGNAPASGAEWPAEAWGVTLALPETLQPYQVSSYTCANLDGDGFDEVVLAWSDDHGGDGAVYVFRGADLAVAYLSGLGAAPSR